MLDIEKLSRMLEAGHNAAFARLVQDKNLKKKPFPDYCPELFEMLGNEIDELRTEVFATNIDWRRIWEEAGDVLCFASRIAELAQKRMF
jgi:hypothetical protein